MNPVHRFLVNIFKCQVRTNFKFLILVYKLLLYPAHSYFSSPTSHHSPPCTLSFSSSIRLLSLTFSSLLHLKFQFTSLTPTYPSCLNLDLATSALPLHLGFHLSQQHFLWYSSQRGISVLFALSLFLFVFFLVCLFVCFSFYGLARGMWKFPGPGIKSMPVLFALIPFMASTTPGKE